MLSTPPRLALLAGLMVLSLAPLPSALGATIITQHEVRDTFFGPQIDPKGWIIENDFEPEVAIVDIHKVDMLASPGAADDFVASIVTRCRAHGNFDARVEFRLPFWPTSPDGISAALDAMPGYAVARTFLDTGDAYTSSLGAQLVTIPTSATIGALRLVRQGSTLSSYYRAGRAWVLVDTNPDVPTTNTQIALRLSSPGTFGGHGVEANYDNFRLHADHIRCYPFPFSRAASTS
jgi:hypothetical protein